MPANGTFHFAKYLVEASELVRFIDVWEVDSIIVNESVALEKWLPYNVVSSASIEIAGRLRSDNQRVLNFEIEGTEQARNTLADTVSSVKLKVIRRHIVSLDD